MLQGIALVFLQTVYYKIAPRINTIYLYHITYDECNHVGEWIVYLSTQMVL